MWAQLKHVSEAEYHHLAKLQGDDESPELAETIRLIASKEYAGQLSVFTSMGRLGLTTALKYEDQHHHWHHPRIGICLMNDRKVSVAYNPDGERSPEATASKILNTPSEAADYVDLLMNRVPYDTTEILERIAEAESRKAAYQNALTEQAGGHQPPTRP